MSNVAFVIMQIGAKDSPERRRADEIYNYIVSPVLIVAGLTPYRADLDVTPGAITTKMLSELLDARLIIADLTGRNPNVFYELGIAHSFSRPLISIADSVNSLPFDAKDERVIELGEYSTAGLAYAQGERAKQSLKNSLEIVLADDYDPSSPLKEIAANRSVDQLAPDNPVAAELAQMRETLEEIKVGVAARSSRPVPLPTSYRNDTAALRAVIERNISFLDAQDFDMLTDRDLNSTGHQAWSAKLIAQWGDSRSDRQSPDPWAESGSQGDEPPF